MRSGSLSADASRKKYQDAHSDEIDSFYFYKKKILEVYPSGSIPTDEVFGRRIKQLTEKRKSLEAEHATASAKSKELMQAQRDIEAYLRQYEPQVQSRDQQKKKKDVLE